MVETNWLNLSLIIFSLLLVIFKLFIQKKERPYKNLPPSPPSLPYVGHLHLLKEPLHASLLSLSQKYGPIVHLRFGVQRVVLVTSSSAVEECFSKTNDITFSNRPQLPVPMYLNYNSTTIPIAPYGELWRNLRRITALEIFTTARLTSTANVRKHEVMLLVRELMQKCGSSGSSQVELKSRFTELLMNTMSMLIMGRRYYGENATMDPKEALHFQHLIEEFMEFMKISNISNFLPILRWMDFGVEKRMVVLMEKMDKFFQDIVSERRRELSFLNEVDGSQGPRMIVDILLSLQETEGEFYTDNIVKGLVMTLLILGSEAPYTVLEWAMSLLLNHPEAMKKVRDEIDLHVGHDRPLEEQDLRKLNYLQNVINETLRLYHPVPLLLPREASVDCKVGGYDVPRGTMLLVNAWAMHRDPNQWENPEKFMPERFEGGAGEGKMIPFGGGRRSCPGYSLGIKIIGLTLGTLIQAFEWERIGAEEINMAASSGIILGKLQPLEAICRPRPEMMHHYVSS